MNNETDIEDVDFSIITPSYNYNKYVRECIDSVMKQEGVSFEHIVYDAGSTDGTLEILKEYDHLDLVVEPDKGMSEAINKGFKRARGKWVMWFNTDDVMKESSLLKMKNILERTDADVVYGGWDFIDSESQFMRRVSAFPFRRLTLAHGNCYIGSTATFLRRETIIDEDHLLNIRFKYVMDGEYYLRLAKLGKKFQYVKEIVSDFRLHGENLSFRHQEKKDIDGLLDKELQYAEQRAIRRHYGLTLFKSLELNPVVDLVLLFFVKLFKQPTKMFNKLASKK